MTTQDIRQKFLDFFRSKGHVIINSASLLPENDPSLLFTNSGMSPLVPYLVGQPHPAGKRLCNSQKCFRAEDIEQVGDGRHNTFFEMLGNWSLGDYFKQEQLAWYYEFLIKILGLEPQRLYQTIYSGNGRGILKDEVSLQIIKDIFTNYGLVAEEGDPAKPGDFSRQRIFAYTDQNWWQRGEAVGELGGPDSETFYDTGKEHNIEFGLHCHPNCDCGRFVEIGNSVFMQYQKTATGWRELNQKNVDFGGGLERTAMILQKADNVFATDLFVNVIKKIEELSGQRYQDNSRAFEVIADHLKAAIFIMGDQRGVGPSNTDQGYLVRRLIRRTLRYGRQLNITAAGWPQELAKIVISDYQDIYPELLDNQDKVLLQLSDEVKKFGLTLERGLKEFDKLNSDLNAKSAFNLYQTYGFPLELTKELAQEKGLVVDEAGFQNELKKHQDLSRTAAAGKFKGGLADQSDLTTKLHTATHLLLAALRRVLGETVFQRGSNITVERLRLDFSYWQKLTEAQIKQIENLVNSVIQADLTVAWQEMSLQRAKEQKVMGIFESKYDEQVRVYTVGAGAEIFSCEICGGPHVEHIGVLGKFKIIKEEASSAGVRRIKAVLIN